MLLVGEVGVEGSLGTVGELALVVGRTTVAIVVGTGSTLDELRVGLGLEVGIWGAGAVFAAVVAGPLLPLPATGPWGVPEPFVSKL